MAGRQTVSNLAAEVELDLDEVLVRLWDAGFDVADEESLVPRGSERRALRALGIDRPEHQKSVSYWEQRLGMTRGQLENELLDLGVHLPPAARVLPKGALKRLRRKHDLRPTIAELELQSTLEGTATAFEFRTVGQPADVSHLTEEEVLQVHEALVKDFAQHSDPIAPPGVKSDQLLSSAVSRPRTSLGDANKYESVEMAGAALLHSLVLNHPFHNGNKRTGLVSTLVFLDRNGFTATCDQAALFKLVLQVAQRRISKDHPRDSDAEVVAIALWIKDNSRPVKRGDRPIPFHQLRRILSSLGCTYSEVGRAANKMTVHRQVERKRFIGKPKREILSTQIYYRGEGREVDRNALHKIRVDLELDEAHGMDSSVFYDSQLIPDDFIQIYAPLLRRLGRL